MEKTWFRGKVMGEDKEREKQIASEKANTEGRAQSQSGQREV